MEEIFKVLLDEFKTLAVTAMDAVRLADTYKANMEKAREDAEYWKKAYFRATKGETHDET